jgi:CRISPR-associated protein Cas1
MWPCRGVAEHAYCPRLFYYMTVEGVFLPSSDTEQGLGTHRRVDRPSQFRSPTLAGATPNLDEDSESPADPQRPQAVRSLVLSSESLGLTATLDLVTVEGMRAVPVEYRKGRPKRIAESPRPVDDMLEDATSVEGPQPWPTDRLQLGLQILLLEEAGYQVPGAYLYYAAERLKLPVVVDDELRAFARDGLEAAKRTAQGSRPLPLLNDARCPRCSLQPICLPDEIHFHRRVDITVNGQPTSENDWLPRKMWPPRDDGIQVIVQRTGARVGVRGQSVRVTDADGDLLREVPLANIESLAVLGSVQISSQALSVMAEHEVPVAYLSAAGRLVAMMDPLGPTSASVRAAQVRVLDQKSRALEFAKAVTRAKLSNQRTLLMRNYAVTGGLPSHVAAALQSCIDRAETSQNIGELRGHEGQGAALYFAHFAKMLKAEVGDIANRFDENGRQRRPPPDPINAVLSFAYSMLTNECTVAARLASLEPTIGALHASRPGRPALSLDLIEPFRPLIADSIAVSAFNRGELTAGHFLQTAAGCVLSDAGRKVFFSAYSRRMETEVTHPVFEYRLSYRRMLMLHARLLAAWLLGEVPALSFLTTR